MQNAECGMQSCRVVTARVPKIPLKKGRVAPDKLRSVVLRNDFIYHAPRRNFLYIKKLYTGKIG